MKRAAIAATAAATAIVGLLPGCETSTNDGSVRVDTLSGGRIVVYNPDTPAMGPPPALVEELRIGLLDEPCTSLGNAFSLAVDDRGRIHVADYQTDQIRVFSPEGQCLRTFGREGEGPGEFAMLAGIAWQPPGFLWAMDALRKHLTVFDSRGDVLATHRLEESLNASLPWPLWVDDDGNLHRWDPASWSIVKNGAGPGLIALDSFPLPRIEQDTYTQGGGEGNVSIRMMSSIPHSPRITSAVNQAGNIWLANTSVFALHETTYRGDTVRTVRLDRPGPKLEGRERDSIAAATGVSARRLPETKTLLEQIGAGTNGWFWVGRSNAQGWDVFDERGYYLGPVIPPVPIESEPFPVFGRGTVTGVTKDELGIQYVVRLRVVR